MVYLFDLLCGRLFLLVLCFGLWVLLFWLRLDLVSSVVYFSLFAGLVITNLGCLSVDFVL